MKISHALIGAAFLAGSSAIASAEPVALNNAELDGVTAGMFDAFFETEAFATSSAEGEGALLSAISGTIVGGEVFGDNVLGNFGAFAGSFSESESSSIGIAP